MIKVLGLLLGPLSSWVEVSGPIIIFGLYYGFLATLPFGPSKIYSTRSFLLGKPGYGIIAISGSITGQLIGFLSMYYSPIYAALWKPYAITLLVVPYMFFRFFQIKSFNIFVFQLSVEKKLKVSRQRKNFSVSVTLIGKYFDYQVSSLLRMCGFEKRTNKPSL